MRTLFASLAAAIALAAAAPAHAQLIGQPGGATMASVVGVHAFFIVESESMAAKKSFEAILTGADGEGEGKSLLVLSGGGLEITRLWKGAFARVAATRTKQDGSRVIITGAGTVIPLRVPLTVEITPIEIGGGWRFGNAQERRVVPYVGAALLAQRYRETSDGASSDENVEATDKGESIFGGVEVAIGPVRLGAEAQFRNVPVPDDSIGTNSVFAAFGDKNLGGTVFRMTFGVGF
jgi:hypothetical protein